MIPGKETTSELVTRKRTAILAVALCVLVGTIAGTLVLSPVASSSGGSTAAGNSGAATDTPVTGDASAGVSKDSATGGNSTNASTQQVSDCDLIDVDGHNNTIAVGMGNNTTADGVDIQYHCGGDNAATVDHDLVDIDGNNNSVTVIVRAENNTIAFGEKGNVASNHSSGLHVALQCAGSTSADCDAIDIDGHNNSVTFIVQSNDGRTVHEFGSNSSDSVRSEN